MLHYNYMVRLHQIPDLYHARETASCPGEEKEEGTGGLSGGLPGAAPHC